VDAVNGRRQVDYMFGWESARTGFGESALFHLAQPAVIKEIIVDTYQHRLNPPLSCHVFGLQAQDTRSSEQTIEQCMAAKPRWSIVFDDELSVVPDDFTAYMQAKQYLDEPTDNARTFTIQLRNEQYDIWKPLVSFGQLRPDTWHRFREIEFTKAVTHILYMHYPNGGIHGLQLYGEEI
jgi:allantoicase